jgi:hypothetical protein
MTPSGTFLCLWLQIYDTGDPLARYALDDALQNLSVTDVNGLKGGKLAP